MNTTIPNLKTVIAFLQGEGELDGVGFGDKHPTERGAFWWRKYLRAATEAAAQGKRQPLTEGDAKDAERYRWLRSIGHEQLNIMAHYAGVELDQAIDAAIASQKADHGITATTQGKI